MVKPIKKLAGYGTLAVLTAPIWYPLSIAGYLTGYSMVKVAKFVTNKPGASIGALALTGALVFGCNELRETTLNLPHQQRPAVINSNENVYYFVKPGETLNQITENLSDNKMYSQQEENNILPGSILSIPKDQCTKNIDGLYSQIPDLEQVILSPETSISEYFGKDSEDVLKLNRILGLDYSDSYLLGDRVVWYLPTSL